MLLIQFEQFGVFVAIDFPLNARTKIIIVVDFKQYRFRL